MRGIGRGKALLYALVALAVGAVSYLIGVRSGFGQSAEDSALGASNFTYDPPAPLSLVNTATVGVALLVVGLIAWVYRRPLRAFWILGFSGAALLASQLLKQQWLERPSFSDLSVDNTFPSGHMTVFAVAVAGLVWAMPAASRGIVALLGALLLGTVSWQLLAFGWHRPSDVLGGIALVVLVFGVASALHPPAKARATRPEAPAAQSMNRVLGAILTIAGWVLVSIGLLLVGLAGILGSDELLLGGSEVAMVGAGSLAARAFMRLSEW